MNLLKIAVALFLVVVLTTCGKKESIPPAPEASVLVAPLKDEVCTAGKIISDTESTIEFKWSAAANAESYELTIKNLLTNSVSNQQTSTTSLEVTLKRNTPYSWFITSKSSKSLTTASSPVWKFYNSGLGVISYPPYPAEIISPTLGQKLSATNGKITLQWRGLDTDNDIANYDVYFGTTNTPAILQSKLTESSLSNVSVNSATTYYWKVITRDTKGNTSDSGLYQFSIN
jgi:hypothetical protein